MHIRLDTAQMQAYLTNLQDLRDADYNRAVRKSITEILNRARSPGGTPVDTGELRISSGASATEMGYTKEYAPHVEYGHRTRGGGFVQGQYFLKQNVDLQRPVFLEDLRRLLQRRG